MRDSKLSKNENSQKDELKKMIDYLTVLSSKINMSLLEFDRKLNLEEKKKCFK